MARQLVYLDHSVLSNLAKQTCFITMEELVQLVESDHVIFPFSWTHHTEAVLDSRLRDAIYRAASEFCRGVRFLTPAYMVSRQARRAFLATRGDQEELNRREAYEHDPDGEIPDGLAQKMRYAGVTLSPEGRSEAKQNKELFAESLNRERASRPPARTLRKPSFAGLQRALLSTSRNQS